MIEEADGAGFGRLSPSLISDWVKIGLLDNPDRVPRPPGQGRGALYLWPDHQRDLFLSLLKHRPGGNDIGRLLPIPVSVWLFWGDDFGVSISQVRRALTSWSRSYQNHYATEDRSLAYARLAVNGLAGPKASREDKRLLREALTDALNQNDWDQDRIAPLALAVVDPGALGRSFGPFAMSPAEVISYLGSMIRGLSVLDEASDGMLLEVRARHREFISWYMRDWASRRSEPSFGDWFEEPTLDFIISGSCRDVVRHLGGMDIARQSGQDLPPVQLGTWPGLRATMGAAYPNIPPPEELPAPMSPVPM